MSKCKEILDNKKENPPPCLARQEGGSIFRKTHFIDLHLLTYYISILQWYILHVLISKKTMGADLLTTQT